MKTRSRFLVCVLCLLMVGFCVFGLNACGDDKCSHQWGEWSVTTNATCTEAGKKERKCSECGETETSAVDALGHTWKEATCAEPKTCTKCQATEGSVASHSGGVATCKAKAVCKVCGKEYGDFAAHTPNADDGDCTTEVTCSVCGGVATAAKTHVFDNACDKTCNNENCNYTRVTSHKPNADDGDCSTPITCSICGEITTAAKAHKGGVATCTVKAKCEVCGKEYGNLAPHVPNEDDGDCMTDTTCSICGAVTTKAKGHTGGTATCKEKAKCATCGKEYGDFAAHKPNADDGDCTTEVTCSVCGVVTTAAKASHTGGVASCTAKAKCATCGKEYGEIDPENHVNVTVKGNFSECEGGEKSSRCKDCGKSWQEKLVAKGHDYQGGKCTVCNESQPTNIFITEYTVEKDVVTVTIKLTGVVKVTGFKLTVNYDPNVLYLDETSKDGSSFDATVNDKNEGEVILVYSNSKPAKTEGLVLTMSFSVERFANTEITLNVEEIRETWYDNSIHETPCSANGVKISLV